MPLFYRRPNEWQRIMRSTIAFNGSYFNMQRMLEQYVLNAYFPAPAVLPTRMTELLAS